MSSIFIENAMTDLDGSHPFSHPLLAPFAVHNAGAATAAEQRPAGIFVCRLAKMGNLLAGRDVVGPDQSVPKRNRGRHRCCLPGTLNSVRLNF